MLLYVRDLPLHLRARRERSGRPGHRGPLREPRRLSGFPAAGFGVSAVVFAVFLTVEPVVDTKAGGSLAGNDSSDASMTSSAGGAWFFVFDMTQE